MFTRQVLMIACLVGPAGCVSADDQADRLKALEWMMAGGRLTATQATALETALEKEPEKLEYRTKLAAFYMGNRFKSPQAAASFREHAIWIIRNHPASEVARLAYVRLDPMIDAKAYQEAVQVWDKHIKKNPTDIKILGNAAVFFLFTERDKAEKYLKKNIRLDPDNPEWSDRLGRLYAIQSRTLTGIDLAAAKESLSSYEEAMRKGKSDRRFPLWLQEAARAAVRAEELEKAEKYAAEVLSLAVEEKPSWNYGNAVHDGNLVLGHVALHRGDIEDAGKFLLKAGKTSGSPQLNSFGPNMGLALELLKDGQDAVVIEYLKLCKKFWNSPELAKWIGEVEQGVVPDFGDNLDY